MFCEWKVLQHAERRWMERVSTYQGLAFSARFKVLVLSGWSWARPRGSVCSQPIQIMKCLFSVSGKTRFSTVSGVVCSFDQKIPPVGLFGTLRGPEFQGEDLVTFQNFVRKSNQDIHPGLRTLSAAPRRVGAGACIC